MVRTVTRQIVLLRGINVGKAKRIAMADLRELLEGLGYADVKTHLQSGNAVVTSTSTTTTTAAAVKKALAAEANLDVEVVARTAAELSRAIAADPFGDIATDGSKHLLGFLSGTPAAAQRTALEAKIGTPEHDSYAIKGDHVYLWAPEGVLNSLFAKVDWDRGSGRALHHAQLEHGPQAGRARRRLNPARPDTRARADAALS